MEKILNSPGSSDAVLSPPQGAEGPVLYRHTISCRCTLRELHGGTCSRAQHMHMDESQDKPWMILSLTAETQGRYRSGKSHACMSRGMVSHR